MVARRTSEDHVERADDRALLKNVALDAQDMCIDRAIAKELSWIALDIYLMHRLEYKSFANLIGGYSIMARIALWFIVVGSLATSAATGYLAYSSASDTLLAVPEVQDFGQLFQGDERVAEFKIANDFAGLVEIISVSPDCDCTEATVSKNTLKRRDQATVSTKWLVGRSRGPRQTIVKVIYRRPDKVIDVLPLTLRGDVVPDLQLQPGQLRFRAGERSSEKIEYSQTVGKSADVKEVTISHRAFQVKIERRMQNGGVIHVDFDPNLWLEEETAPAEILIQTTSRHEPWCRVKILVDRQEL